MKAIRTIATLAALSLAAPAIAAPSKPCLAPDEMAAVISAIAPSAVASAARQCRPFLPADAYLTRSAAALAAKLRPGALAAVHTSRGALGRIAGLQLPAALSDSAIMGMIDAGAADEIIGQLKPYECAAIDRALSQVDSLPAQNLAALLAALAELGVDDDADFTVCRPTT